MYTHMCVCMYNRTFITILLPNLTCTRNYCSTPYLIATNGNSYDIIKE